MFPRCCARDISFCLRQARQRLLTAVCAAVPRPVEERDALLRNTEVMAALKPSKFSRAENTEQLLLLLQLLTVILLTRTAVSDGEWLTV